MAKCEIDKLGLNTCEQDMVANVTVTGDAASVTLDVCQQHFDQLTGTLPTELSDTAKRQQER